MPASRVPLTLRYHEVNPRGYEIYRANRHFYRYTSLLKREAGIMGSHRLRAIDVRTVVLPYTSYAALAFFLLDVVINRVLYFLTRYQVWSDLLASKILVNIGFYSFLFGELASVFLLILLISLMFRMRPSAEHYIALPMMLLLAADILKYILRITFELSALTVLLNISSLTIILMAVLSRLKRREVKRGPSKVLAYIHLSLLTVILILQHLYQLDLLVFNGQALNESTILEVIPYLMLADAFAVTAYASSVSYREFPRLLMKPEAFASSLTILIVALGLLYVSSLVPQAIPELLTSVLKVSLPVTMLPLILIGLVFFLSASLTLWLKTGPTYIYRQEAVGLLMIFSAIFLFGSIYYYPRVVLGIILVSVSLFKDKPA